MKKRIITLVLSIIFISVLLTGCAAQSSSAPLADNFPWANDVGTLFYEKTGYTVTRKNATGGVIAEGTLTYEIDKLEGLNIFKLNMVFSLTYSAGETDEITSVSYFSSSTLAPAMTAKTAVYKNTVDYDWYEIGPKNNYSYNGVYTDTTIGETEYKAGASGTIGLGSDIPVELTMNMSQKGAGSADNEYVFFYTRALKNLKTGGSGSFSLYNIYEGLNQVTPGLRSTPMSLSAEKNAVDYAINTALVTNEGSDTTFLGTDGAVKAIKATLAINSSNKGTNTILYYSDPISDSLGLVLNNRKVLLGMETEELSPATGKILYTLEYKLNSYTRLAQ